MKAFEVIANTDPLAQIALAGLLITLIVTAVLFGFLMTRKDAKKAKV